MILINAKSKAIATIAPHTALRNNITWTLRRKQGNITGNLQGIVPAITPFLAVRALTNKDTTKKADFMWNLILPIQVINLIRSTNPGDEW